MPLTQRSYEKSNHLLQRSLQTIPLGSQTFSKSYLNLVNGCCPLFLDHGKGAYVWDVDGNDYIDFLLALMPVVLGYADEDVNTAIVQQLEKGISFSMSTELEIELSEKLVDLIPSAEMVRFGKNGSDVTTGALRIARAYTGREKVGVCGYHGWHDWYLGGTKMNLGIPKHESELISHFSYNDAQSLEDLLKKEPDAYAAIMMEPANALVPEEGFLQDIRDIADKYGCLLIYDEVCSGWRPDIGGAQQYYGVTPDLSCFGKAMANGMPIAALVGRQDLMNMMEKIFFSSTFGGETLSIAASIATIDKMIKTNTPKKINETGIYLKTELNQAIKDVNLDDHLSVGGVDWWPRLVWGPAMIDDKLLAMSLIRQELAEVGIIQGTGFNLCLSHSDEDVKKDIITRWKTALDILSEAYLSNDAEKFMRGEKMQPPYSVR